MDGNLKIIRIGNAAGIILPEQLLAHLGAEIGYTLSVVRTSRGIELSATAPDRDVQMAAAHEVMKRRKGALKALAIDEEEWAIAERIMEEDRAILSQLAKE